MKESIAILMATLLAILCLSSCGTPDRMKAQEGGASEDRNKIKIVATIFPEYDWTMNILGDKAGDAEVTLLMNKGVDLHSFQPTAKDFITISECDLFIYVGGESDEWVEDALKEAVNKDMQVINLLETLEGYVREEEMVEGMQEEKKIKPGREEKEDEIEYDEHVWLSLKNASVICDAIADKLCELDKENAEEYRKNLDEYKTKLSELDEQYKSVIDSSKEKTILFGDRFPFRYMTEDYGLDYYAAFTGCSAETEASFETIVFLAKKTDELGLKTILTTEGSDKRIAMTIRDNTASKDQEILVIDSMQATTDKDAENGTDYLSVMRYNLKVLRQALN